MGDHAKLSPSASKRWMHCPGCIRLAEEVGGEEKTSVYAAEGTLAHWLAEWTLKNNEQIKGFLNSNSMLGATVPEISKDIKIDQGMIDYVWDYVNVIRADAAETGAEITAEEEFDLGWLVPEMFGTNDAKVGEFMGLLRIYDLKYGSGVIVEPEWNSQAMIYALGAVGEGNPNMYDEVELVIHQPRAPHPDGPTRRWRVTVERLFKWGEVMKERAAETAKPDAPLTAGEWCQFCKAMAVCPEIAKEAAESAMVEFGAVVEGPKQTPISLPQPDALTDEQLCRVLDFTKILGAWSKEVEAYVLQRMESGVAMPGYKLVKKKSNRFWLDESSTIDFLHRQYGKDIYTEPKLKTPAQAEKLPGMNKAALANYWDKRDTGVTIAPLTDKRKAVAPSAQVEFTEGDDFLV